jgi:branched-chain amino acid transport system ATP-binding protein
VNPLLEIRNIETYYDLIYAIRGASLTVDSGSVTAILGNNGAGKSTILKTMLGLIEDQPDKGTILFEGERIDGRDTEDIVRRGISYVPEGREIFEELTVRENLLMGAYTRRDRDGVRQDFERVYDYFPVLSNRTHQWAGTLSGGEQQMLAIGRALMTHPRLLLLDEATEGLAPKIRNQIWRCLEILKQQGLSILVVDKNVDALLRICDRLYIIQKGRNVWQGTPMQFTSDPTIRQDYLGI